MHEVSNNNNNNNNNNNVQRTDMLFLNIYTGVYVLKYTFVYMHKRRLQILYLVK